MLVEPSIIAADACARISCKLGHVWQPAARFNYMDGEKKEEIYVGTQVHILDTLLSIKACLKMA